MAKKVKDITKSKRYFRIGELVYNCNYARGEEDNFDWGKILLINGKEKDGLVDEDTIVTLAMEHNNFKGENECYGENIYKICKRQTKMVGERVCFEHKCLYDDKDHKYPYYIPGNDENYSKFELDRMWLDRVTKKHKVSVDSDRTEMPWDYGKHFD